MTGECFVWCSEVYSHPASGGHSCLGPFPPASSDLCSDLLISLRLDRYFDPGWSRKTNTNVRERKKESFEATTLVKKGNVSW